MEDKGDQGRQGRQRRIPVLSFGCSLSF
jgi:hypothetical protein